MIYEDQLAAIQKDTTKVRHDRAAKSTWPCSPTAWKTSGSRASRSTWRTAISRTDKRKFIIADTPGHEQYTRNMATGASTADLAIILIDARHGVLVADQAAQLHRLAARHQARRRRHQQDGHRRFQRRRSSTRSAPTTRPSPPASTCPTCISSRSRRSKGDNVVDAEPEHALVHRPDADEPAGNRLYRLRPQPRGLPLSRAVRPAAESRLPRLQRHDRLGHRPQGGRDHGPAVAQDEPRQVDRHVRRRPAKKPSRRKSVTLTLEDEIDISRGDMLVRPGNVPRVEQKFEAMVVWMSEEPMVPGKSYWFKQTTQAHARHDQHAAVSGRCQHAPSQGRPHAHAQRNRPLHDHAQPADLFRRLPPQPGDRGRSSSSTA